MQQRRNSDHLLVDRDAPARRIDLDDGSWIDLVASFVRDPGDAMDSLHDSVDWQQSEVLRYDRYVEENRLGAGLDAQRVPLLRQAELHLRATYRVPLSGVAAILYRRGDDFQGLHSDRELRWLDDTVIAIMVLGERRPFVVRRRHRPTDAGRPGDGGGRGAGGSIVDRAPAGALDDDIVLHPGQGDLVVMGGACQRDWLHGVPAAPTELPRISLTWRWTSRRGRPDTAPGYFDGRQFSDLPRRPGHRTRR